MDGLDIRAIQRALQEAGMSRRQAKALLFGGWREVAGEAAAEAAALRLELDTLRSLVQSGTIAPSSPDAGCSERRPTAEAA